MLMQTDAILEVEGVSKIYSRTPSSTRQRLAGVFGRTLVGRPASTSHDLKNGEFWSLKDVSFSLKRGEALGIIGLNGAGKTTLLRILSGQILPDEGEIRLLGETAAMIDLTAGFQMTASGKHNIQLRGAMLGRSRQNIEASYDAIVAFADLGVAIDAPVNTYSSGMLMRLAFAIMIEMEPDILFIDEVLAVGDFLFQQKCLARIRELRDRAAFVLVSHSMANISRFCSRVIVLKNGKIAFKGEPDEAVEFYLEERRGRNVQKSGRKKKKKPVAPAAISSSPKAFQPVAEPAVLKLAIYAPVPYHDPAAIDDIRLLINGGRDQDIKLDVGSSLDVEIVAGLIRPMRRLIFGVTILTQEGEGIFGISSDAQRIWLAVDKKCNVKVRLAIPSIYLNPGKYMVYLNARDNTELIFRKKIIELEIYTPAYNVFGVITIPHKWSMELSDDDIGES